MKIEINNENKEELMSICENVREMLENNELNKCDELLKNVMKKYPHSAVPHNLYGILFEKEGDHAFAMKHFRAAWALDPTYLPVRFNLNEYSTFYQTGKLAYDENDCPEFDKGSDYVVEYNDKGVGHLVRRGK